MHHTIPVTNAPSPCDDDKLREIFATEDAGGPVHLTPQNLRFVARGIAAPTSVHLADWGLFLSVPDPDAHGLAVERSPSD